MEIATLKVELAKHAPVLCPELFSDGVIEHGCFKIGNVHGEKGRSLSVFLHGDRAGQWTDFEAGDHGDLIDLICHSKGVGIPAAMDWAKKRFNIRDIKPSMKVRSAQIKRYSKPVAPEQTNTDSLHTFLEGRGFRDVGELVYRHKIYETADLKTQGSDLVFQFFDPAGKLVFLKNKPLDYDGNPGMCNQSGMQQILYGWHTIPDTSRTVWLTEGELDAIAARELGFPALSLPSGASNLTWLEAEFDNLARFEEIVLATDHDEAGEKCAEKLKQRLGDRAFRVRFPAKDINELIQERGYDDARKILKSSYEDAKWQAPEQLRTVVEFEDELDAFFDAKENDSGGFRSGFEKFDENDVRFREHDLWLVAGFSGSGKSMMLNQLCLNAITQDRKILIASMEMTPRYTLGRMLMQTCGVRKPEKDWRKRALDWLAPNLWLFVDDLTPKPADLLRTFEYGYRRYGINVFVIDSLTNMVRQDDYEGQQKFVEALVQFKLKFNVTIFLVAHARKQENESRAPGKFDIKGSSAISDLCDGAFSVWKNKPKAEHLEACRIFNEPVNEDIAKSWDIHLEVLKNRHGMWEGKIGFDFEEGSCQYLERRPAIPKAYVPKPKEKLF